MTWLQVLMLHFTQATTMQRAKNKHATRLPYAADYNTQLQGAMYEILQRVARDLQSPVQASLSNVHA
jgi:hypothetical protein